MTKFRLSAIVAGLAVTTMAATSAWAVNSKAECEYAGGETFNIGQDLVCLAPIRGEEFHSEIYDDQQLGVKDCNGDIIADGVFCKITLVKGKRVGFSSKEEAERAAAREAAAAEARNASEAAQNAVKDAAEEVVEAPKKKTNR